MKNNTLVVHDCEHTMTRAYREGARAFRRSVPWNCNPYRPDTDGHEAWSDGHVNDSAGEHYRFGKDLVEAPCNGARFEMDASVPRESWGDVSNEWHAQQRQAFEQVANAKAARPQGALAAAL